MNVKYFNTLYEQEETMRGIDKIEFKDDRIVFSHMGFKIGILYHLVISITKGDE